MQQINLGTSDDDLEFAKLFFGKTIQFWLNYIASFDEHYPVVNASGIVTGIVNMYDLAESAKIIDDDYVQE